LPPSLPQFKYSRRKELYRGRKGCLGCENKLNGVLTKINKLIKGSPSFASAWRCFILNLFSSLVAFFASRISCSWIRLIFIRDNYAGARFSETKLKQSNL
jgi:hypothetical protein